MVNQIFFEIKYSIGSGNTVNFNCTREEIESTIENVKRI